MEYDQDEISIMKNLRNHLLYAAIDSSVFVTTYVIAGCYMIQHKEYLMIGICAIASFTNLYSALCRASLYINIKGFIKEIKVD